MSATIVSRASDVRISEINLSQVITGASTCVGAMVVVSKQGKGTPELFTNAPDFIAQYGDPNPSISMTIQSGLNFLTEGNQLWAVRALGEGYKTSGVVMYNDAYGVTKLRGVGVVDPTLENISGLVAPNEEAIALFYANKGPGSYGDKYAISISTSAVNAPATLSGVSANSGGSLPSASYVYQVSALSTAGESLASNPVHIVVSGVTQATASNRLDWTPVSGAIGYRIYGRVSNGTFGLLGEVGAASYAFIDTGALVADTSILPILDASKAAAVTEFMVRVWDTTTTQTALQEYNCTLTPNVDESGVQTELEDRINPFSGYIQVVSNVQALLRVPAITNVAQTQMAGGDSGTAPMSSNIIDALKPFSNRQLYPTNTFINGGISDPVVQRALDALVQARGDAVALLDVPATNQAAQASVDYRNLTLNLNSSYSALFTDDLLQADPINGKLIYSPPSGWAAALCARTDRVSTPAHSIAGLNRGMLNVLKPRYNYDDGESTALYNAQVNYVRTFSGIGTALWEQRTLSSQSSGLSWLSVRRILNVIKVALYNYLIYAVQEMGVDSVRRQLVNSCNSYLATMVAANSIFSGQAICDNTNNTADTANAGILVFSVVIVPLIPIHEVQLQVVVSKQGVTFTETLNQLRG